MRLVLDTNTVLSGLLWSGAPAKLIDVAQAGRIELFTSAPLLAELQGVLMRSKFTRQLTKRALIVNDLFDGYAALATVVNQAPIAPSVARDPDDDQVLACAVAAEANLIVSGDRDLLSLATFEGIPIVTATEALERISAGQE